MVPASKSVEKLAETAAVYLGRSPTERGVGRLMADLSDDQKADACVEAFRPLAEMGRKPRPCIECGDMTTGSVGAAGIRWPALCQTCKDQADGDLSSRIKAAGSIGNALYMGLMERSRLEIIDRETRHEQTRREFLADFEAKTRLEIHPFTPDPSKVSDPLPCSTCGGPVPPTPQDPASVSARESALMAGWVPVCDKCRRIEEEND